MDIQKIYYTNKDSKRVYYLVNNREKRYCVIPREYYGLCDHLYCIRLSFAAMKIEEVCEGYDLVELNEVNG